MTAEAALLLFLIKNSKALPEWTPKVKKQKANKMLCLLMSLKLNLTIAGSRFLGVCACLGVGVLCQAGGEGSE